MQEFYTDRRRAKRGQRHHGYNDPVWLAMMRGQRAVELDKPESANPYPPGIRHDAWAEAWRVYIHDPLGDHHGRNE